MTWRESEAYHFEPDLDHTERPYYYAERTCVARLADISLAGENRFYIAPAEDGSWFAWGDWHYLVENPDPHSRAVCMSESAGDATYLFAGGGAYFPTCEAAMAAIYRWLARDTTRDLAQWKEQL